MIYMSYFIYQSTKAKKNNFYNIFHEYFKSINIKKINIKDPSINNIDFVWCYYIDSNLIKKKTKLLNYLVNFECISNKYLIYKNLESYFPNNNITPKCILLTHDTIFDNTKLYISRPTKNIKTKENASCGKDIIIIDSEQKLIEAKNNLLNYKDIVLTEYIKNPLLFQNRKFHFRCFMIYTNINSKNCCYMFDLFTLVTAKDPYSFQDFQNKDIHDTHYIDQNNEFYYPKDFTKDNLNLEITQDILSHINNSIKNICKKLGYILKDNFSIFCNSKNGYHIFGLDIMITDNFDVKLIECNYHPMIEVINNNPYRQLFNNKLLTFILNTCIKPYFEKNYICLEESLL